MSGLPSCALKTLSVFTSERIVFIACLLLSEYSFERLYHIANFEHDQPNQVETSPEKQNSSSISNLEEP